jgi:protoheme IX farnesyltransferase
MSFVSESTDRLLPMPSVSTAEPEDFIALLKPRVMSLVIFTALAGLLIAPNHVNPIIGFASLLAIAVGAGASGALNMWYDCDIDAIMKRTRTRPIPAGTISPREALAFGLILAAFAVFTLGFVANWAAASFLAFTIFFYVVIYTMWLKRRTPQNIVIGGAAGAFPPMVAYMAATGQISLASLALFAIIFVWTPPHFWSLALVKSDEYAKANIPMMPNVKGHDRTRLEILLYTLALAPIGMAPWFLGFASSVYAVLAGILGAVMLFFASRVYIYREGGQAERRAKQLFGFSILYLSLLFGEIISERLLSIAQSFFK